jgi:hypothetical protein
MPRFIILFTFLLGSLLQAQERFIIRVYDQNNAALTTLVQGLGGVNIVRFLNYPGQQLNGLAVIVDDGRIRQVRNELDVTYAGNYLLLLDPIVRPNEGSGDTLTDPIFPAHFSANPVLDSLVPGRPITAPPIDHLPGNVLVDIIGTGVDYSHPDFSDLTFDPALSVMFSLGGGFLPGDIDYHNHETRMTGCIAGLHTGLLTALGTAEDARFRSVLCYDKPSSLGPAVPTTYASDCIAAMAELISAHEARLSEPYLHNHAAVLCFSHSVEAINTRVGDLDSLFDLAWERGIVTSISAGNHYGTAAASSPAGAGEWVAFNNGGGVTSKRYWPPLGYPSYALPGAFGFDTTGDGAEYHLKSGAHDNTLSPWFDSGTLGTGLNTPNPVGYGPAMNGGVDLFAPGVAVPVPATRLDPTTGIGPIMVDDDTYFLEQGYQAGNGTSYSAAFTAAMATRILQLRPWATPDQVRAVILDATMSAGGINVLALPDFSSLPAMSLTYDAWILRYADVAPPGYFDTGMDAYTADPDYDGIANFIEYYCGMDPRYRDAPHAPVVSFDSETNILSVTMQRACYLPKSSMVEWRFQACDDLLSWSDAGQGIITSTPHTDGNGDGITITANLDILTAAPKQFYRFSISVSP